MTPGTSTMLRARRRDVNVKPNRRLDRKSSRGMLYENEELRLRTININAEVERGNYAVQVNKRTGHKNLADWGVMSSFEDKGKYGAAVEWQKIRCHLKDNFVFNIQTNHWISENNQALMWKPYGSHAYTERIKCSSWTYSRCYVYSPLRFRRWTISFQRGHNGKLLEISEHESGMFLRNAGHYWPIITASRHKRLASPETRSCVYCKTWTYCI